MRRLMFVVLAVGTTFAQSSLKLFPVDTKCACIRTKKSSDTAVSKNLVVEGRLWQGFSNRQTGQEMFRLEVGLPDEFESKLWNYGLTVERDVNSDGVVDYAWYGGDDTVSHSFLALSSGSGYRILNIEESAAAVLARLWAINRPVLDEVGGEFQFGDIWIEPARDLVLVIRVRHFDPVRGSELPAVTFRVSPQDFHYIR